jgi:predicted RNase H-like HicB family nuclease
MDLKVLTSEGEDGWIVVQCPSIPGCISQGRNLKEALDNIKEAIEGCLEVMGDRIKATGGAGSIIFRGMRES